MAGNTNYACRETSVVRKTSLCSLFINVSVFEVGLGGLGVKCSPRDPKFASLKNFSGRKNPE